MASQKCPLEINSPQKIAQYLHSLPFNELCRVAENIHDSLSPTEKIRYDIRKYCTSYSDFQGRVKFILTLVNDAIIVPLAIPDSVQRHPKIAEMMQPGRGGYHLTQTTEKEDSGDEALTDEMAAAAAASSSSSNSTDGNKKKPIISNPRWEHVDEPEEGSENEDPYLGDTIRLLADIKEYPEGAPVSFDIYDMTGSTPFRITTVSGKNEGGIASAEWTVEDPQERGATLKLQFEAGASSKYTEKAGLPWQDTLQCDFVEMPDVLFHHNSAVPCLDAEGTLPGASSATFLFAKENPDKEIVIFGHTDTSGDPAYNYDLSEWRADGIKALLENDSQTWLDVVDLASKVEDYQSILKSLTTSQGWNCDPGRVDNADGPKTKDAVKAFQEQYNRKFKGDLKVDGIIGGKTWTAIFNVNRKLIEDTVKTETGEETLPALAYGYKGKGIYPCGESFPVDSKEKDDYTSETNRRVEIVFYDKGKAPELKPPADKKKGTKKENPVYDKKKTKKKPVPVTPPKPVDSDTIILELVNPQVFDTSKPHKQYVNLPDDGREQGVALTIRVKAKDLKANTAGKRVYWRITADANNSKRNSPKTGVMEKTGGTLVEFTADVANIDTAFNGSESSIVLACGLAGGDRFTVEAGTDGSNFTTKFVVENWRKLWYQMTYEDKLKLYSTKQALDAFNLVNIDFCIENKKMFKKQDVPDRTYYPEWMFSPGGKDKEIAVIGSHNKYFFRKLFVQNAKNEPKAHAIICEQQWDEGDVSKNITTVFSNTKSKKIAASIDVIKPALKGPVIVNGEWWVGTGSHKKLDDTCISIDKKRINMNEFILNLPNDAQKEIDNKNKVTVKLTVRGADGPFAGERSGEHVLVVHNYPKDFNDTICHEIGHGIGMVPKPGQQPSGLTPHPHQYVKCGGGNGTHCSTVKDKAKKEKKGVLNKGIYTTGICVMFHESDNSCIDRFCDTCSPYVKAAELLKFGK